jgi:ferredoxin
VCEFCTKHGEGQIWYRNAANYAQDLLADLNRRRFIEQFLEQTINEGFVTLGRLEALVKKRGRLPDALKRSMEERARVEHFGQVLPVEEIAGLVRKAATIVRMPCACRWTEGRKELRCCYGISLGPEAWYSSIDMGYFGKTPSEGLESVSSEEAVRHMEALEEQGAVHTIWTMVTPFIGAICNCSAMECMALRMLRGIKVETLARAEFVASVDAGRCEGCGLCALSCQFDAIGSSHESGLAKAVINPEKCFGCGLCRKACAAGAITLVLRHRPETGPFCAPSA